MQKRYKKQSHYIPLDMKFSSVQVSLEVKEKLKDFAKKNNYSVRSVVDHAIELYLIAQSDI